jgi:hypothetical protein
VGSDSIRKLYRAFPSLLTAISARPLRKEFGTLASLPFTNRQLSEETNGCVLVFIIVLTLYIFYSLTLFVFQVNAKCDKNAVF